MISILNRRELYTGTDAEDAARRHGHGRDGRRGALL